jgi:hypothetical protein
MSKTLRRIPLAHMLRDRKSRAEAERAFRSSRVSESDVRRMIIRGLMS